MSFAIDSNILLYASNEASNHQRAASEFLDQAVAGPEIVFVSWQVISEYLRISTHAAVFPRPLSPETAIANVDSLFSSPHVRILQEDGGFWDTYKSVARTVVTRGAAVPDAHLAALLRHNGIRVLYTNDSDFRRFSFLEVRNPFQ
jgi:toxin-antitoxin system PIN domain toxin